MYRPEGYQEILARTMGAIAPIDAKLVEAGADAMLSTIVAKLEDALENSFVMAYVGEDEPYESTIDPITIREIIEELSGKNES